MQVGDRVTIIEPMPSHRGVLPGTEGTRPVFQGPTSYRPAGTEVAIEACVCEATHGFEAKYLIRFPDGGACYAHTYSLRALPP